MKIHPAGFASLLHGFRTRRATLAGLLVLSATAWSCTHDDGAGPAGPPLDVQPDAWTWQTVAGTRCGSGTSTGIAINPHLGSETLTVYLEGGGACWTGSMCSATNPPFAYNLDGYDEDKFAVDVAGGVTPSQYKIFDRTHPENPFGQDNFVFIPYCTGDVHSGSNIQRYENEDGSSMTIHHVGFDNVGFDLVHIHELFPEVRRVAIVGTSAGGVGATANFARFQAAWPDARAHLVNDAGVILPGAARAMYTAQDVVWHSFANFPADCAECTSVDGGPHRLFAHLAKNPRFSGALLSTNHDSTNSFYYSLPPASQDNAGCQTGEQCEFEDDLADLITGSFSSAGPGRVRAFVPVASTHGFLPNRFQLSAAGVPLKAFLGAQLADDPSWTDAIEPRW